MLAVPLMLQRCSHTPVSCLSLKTPSIPLCPSGFPSHSSSCVTHCSRASTPNSTTTTKNKTSVYTVKLSMMEIYCEMLNDLLDPSKLNLDVQV